MRHEEPGNEAFHARARRVAEPSRGVDRDPRVRARGGASVAEHLVLEHGPGGGEEVAEQEHQIDAGREAGHLRRGEVGEEDVAPGHEREAEEQRGPRGEAEEGEVEEAGERLGLRPVANAVAADIGADLAGEAAVVVAHGAEVELHGPAFGGIQAADMEHDVAGELILLRSGGGGTTAGFLEDALGLGHAVLCAQPVVGDEPFAVILADELIRATDSGPGARGSTAQLADVYTRLCGAGNGGGGVIGVNYMPGDSIQRYGAIKIADTVKHPDGDAMRLAGFVEKPKPAEAPSQFGAIGRYVLPASIFAHLKQIKRGSGGEIQLTDAIATLAAVEPVYAVETVGRRYDCGTKLGYLEATVKLGLERPEFSAEFAAILKQLSL